MTRFSQIAAPAILGAALMVGAQGCAHESPPVAGTHNMLSEGRRTVSATAPNDGIVFIYDDTANKNVYSGRVKSGDRIRLDAEENKVMLNDNVALQQDLLNDHRYQIFFDKQEMTEADMAKYRQPTNNTTIVTPQQQPAPAGTYAQPAQPATVQPAPVQQPYQTTTPQTTTPPAAANIYVQPAAPAQPAAPVQPAQPAIPPAPAPASGQTVVQPDGTTVVTPPAR
jgi:hypothetical protein